MVMKSPIKPVRSPAIRRLRIYAIDPLIAAFENQVVTVEIPWEDLRPGPVSEYIEVIDYDPCADKYYSPVNLEDPNLLAQDGHQPSESDPRFHQQMAYAVVMATHARFERALGRNVRMHGKRGRRIKLRIYPHGTREPNAFYSGGMGALIFGYFRASKTAYGRNLPGGTIFTCLSHDVVAHETTHGILHGLRRRSLEPSGPDVYAFHEAFADIVAILQRFSLPGFLEQAIQRTGAKLDTPDPLFDLGRQFGEAIGRRGALRSAIGKDPDPGALSGIYEPHARGAILVAAVFDALVTIYKRRTGDLLRLAGGGTAALPRGDLAPDLVGRLASEARRAAKHFLNICIRAIDYCPPLDIQFGDYLRAVITADREIVPNDPLNYRTAIIDAFRKRGIYPENVFSLAEDSLILQPPRGKLDTAGFKLDAVRFDRASRPDTKERKKEWNQYARLYTALFKKPRNIRAFGLDRDRPVQLASVQPLQRISPDGRIINELVVQALQQGDGIFARKEPPYHRGGCTLIVNQSGKVRYCAVKELKSAEREERQRSFLRDLESAGLLAGMGSEYREPDFRMIHRGW